MTKSNDKNKVHSTSRVEAPPEEGGTDVEGEGVLVATALLVAVVLTVAPMVAVLAMLLLLLVEEEGMLEVEDIVVDVEDDLGVPIK